MWFSTRHSNVIGDLYHAETVLDKITSRSGFTHFERFQTCDNSSVDDQLESFRDIFDKAFLFRYSFTLFALASQNPIHRLLSSKHSDLFEKVTSCLKWFISGPGFTDRAVSAFLLPRLTGVAGTWIGRGRLGFLGARGALLLTAFATANPSDIFEKVLST